ncbi:hypothetical protein C5167_005389 [Papaver somniferum]|uniref:CRM domain-containing protein n=1 Tax=Papaver somniferum TaxID=3469 RepID=A0A4Y7JC41_PAPSO|nr:hypothetical protein C5167_005389 [Papaver somniferum]
MSITIFFSPSSHHSNTLHFFYNADSFKTLSSKPFDFTSKPLLRVSRSQNEIQSQNPPPSLSEPPPCTKMPTAPWMKEPILIPSDEVLNISRIRKLKNFNNRDDWSLTDKIKGGRGKQAMRKIVDSITKLDDLTEKRGELPQKEAEGYDFSVPIEEVVGEEEEDLRMNPRMPWVVTQKVVFRRTKKERVVTAAELSLPESLLKKLKCDAEKIKKWVKVPKAGVTEAVVDEINVIWKRGELAMVKFDIPLCRYMDRAREIIELKTGGLVVWTKKDTHVVYRGLLHGSPSNGSLKLNLVPASDKISLSKAVVLNKDVSAGSLTNRAVQDENITGKSLEESTHFAGMEEFFCHQLVQGTLYEREADRLLDGLGPRFVDWWWPKPLPVDADLLPEVIPGFMTPFRLCPPHVRLQLADDELTYLRKLARALPTHFALDAYGFLIRLGRNTKLHGLAAAIIKLWEKTHVVKIAVKVGVPNTNNEQMAWEIKASLLLQRCMSGFQPAYPVTSSFFLFVIASVYFICSHADTSFLIVQRLTGGVLILRNKSFIIFYRGKDFVPPRVASLIVSRETELKHCQVEEEGARQKALESLHVNNKEVHNNCTVGTFSDFRDIQAKYELLKIGCGVVDVEKEAEKERLEKELRMQKHKLEILQAKIDKSDAELAKLNSSWTYAEQVVDHEMITQEEKQCLRKMGLKMSKTLLLGRRGIFDGVIESIHQHWKHREVVKVITMQPEFSQVNVTAMWLERESRGLLVAIERLRKGHAIILYRGKNYKRPPKILSGNLLTKREALQRSLEMQRVGSLKFFAYQRMRTISDLELKLVAF